MLATTERHPTNHSHPSGTATNPLDKIPRRDVSQVERPIELTLATIREVSDCENDLLI